MIPLSVLFRGMRVCTPSGAIARVEGFAVCVPNEKPPRVELLFLDGRNCWPLQANLLRVYVGPPVMFADELADLHKKYPGRKHG